jgi:hypothetical protein
MAGLLVLLVRSFVGEAQFLGRDAFAVHHLKQGMGLGFAFPRLETILQWVPASAKKKYCTTWD